MEMIKAGKFQKGCVCVSVYVYKRTQEAPLFCNEDRGEDFSPAIYGVPQNHVGWYSVYFTYICTADS